MEHKCIVSPIPRYIPVAIYTIGLCRYAHSEPYKTVEVKADSHQQAMFESYALLQPSTIEHIKYVGVKPNPEHIEYMSSLYDKNGQLYSL